MQKNNAQCLENELLWFNRVLEVRTCLYFEQESDHSSIYDIKPPDVSGCRSIYSETVRRYGMTFDERLVLILALIPHIRPQLLDTFFINNTNLSRPFTEFGGQKGNTHGGFLPTGETVSFILAGSDLEQRFDVIRLFEGDHFFAASNILKLEENGGKEPFFSGALTIMPEYLSLFTTGTAHKPDYNIHFPAKLIATKLTWEDLILPPEVLDEIENIGGWLKYSDTIMHDWGFHRVIKPGFRSLFYGPPGTGKTMTASLIGASHDIDVYRIDLSMVVSKYIGETEKNLANVFDQAENKNWILFFDEADALFGKRTQASSSNDRHANQEVSYLLQRVEDYPGVVILATNLKSNIDEAFARRFQSVVYFPVPDFDLRLKIWKNVLQGREWKNKETDLVEIAEKYEVTGGAIVNVVRFAAINALKYGKKTLSPADLVTGIGKEKLKEGKTIG